MDEATGGHYGCVYVYYDSTLVDASTVEEFKNGVTGRHMLDTQADWIDRHGVVSTNEGLISSYPLKGERVTPVPSTVRRLEFV